MAHGHGDKRSLPGIMILWAMAAVWMLPSAFAVLTRYYRTGDVVVWNYCLGWFPIVWLGLMAVVLQGWGWWND